MVAIVDYDIGNVAAVANMFNRLGVPSVVTCKQDQIEKADRIILPGNGAFDACMKNLRASGLIPVLEKCVLQRGVPLLGICVGAQMLGHSSEEGVEPGLGWIDMAVKRFPTLPDLRIPQMGWNNVVSVAQGHPVLDGLSDDARFYFVHSYYMAPKDPNNTLLKAHYGIDFSAAVTRGNIVGVQFHPEKSHRFGKQLLSAFARWKA